jgi:hypothetical protein
MKQIHAIVGEAPRPIWARLPKRGELLEGLSRSFIYKLIAAGKIRSISLAEPGAKRGCRLIDLESLRSYIAGLAMEQEGGAES